ncbi:Stress response protein NhaX [Roseivivax jejudonensis]|uniref:Stress response protein NhaX n=1 Tax=Roseivivax jejudonensis TaxID=1529041 RepID=A0A1X6Z3J9_9RHOB|nr:universal stress protein [Roseivivax jejudonensis]SLN39798.1 Stress response protein NhaX [Roseivivax jejudonensis]
MFASILAAYDGSTGAFAALEKAAALAKLTGADLTVLTCYRHHSMLEASLSMVRGAGEGSANLDDIMREVSREAAEEAKTRAKDLGVESVSAFIKNGPSARTIVSFAGEKGCDLIVIGSRGLGSTEGYLLGSVSHKVTSLSDVPVLVV